MWLAGLVEYDFEKGLEWEWQSIDGAMTKTPLYGAGTGANPTDRGKKGTKKKIENYLAMLHLARTSITFRSAGLFG
jgi:hypothetical protein